MMEYKVGGASMGNGVLSLELDEVRWAELSCVMWSVHVVRVGGA